MLSVLFKMFCSVELYESPTRLNRRNVSFFYIEVSLILSFSLLRGLSYPEFSNVLPNQIPFQFSTKNFDISFRFTIFHFDRLHHLAQAWSPLVKLPRLPRWQLPQSMASTSIIYVPILRTVKERFKFVK